MQWCLSTTVAFEATRSYRLDTDIDVPGGENMACSIVSCCTRCDLSPWRNASAATNDQVYVRDLDQKLD